MGMVWLNHSGYFDIGLPYPPLDFLGVLCVEIFFVLSGLLVGKSLILAVTDAHPGKMLRKFYVNRLVRTLPVYYLLLLLTAVVYHTPVPISCFFFLHNYFGDAVYFLPQAWSLSVEAWFYFLVPPVLLVLVRVFSRRFSQEKAVFYAIALLYLIPLVLRILTVLLKSPEWDLGIRKQPHLRLDAVMLGVFFAAGKRYAGERYLRLARNPLTLVVSLGGIAGLAVYYCRSLLNGLLDVSCFWKVSLFTLLPLLCCLLAVYLENAPALQAIADTLPARFVCRVGTWGYGIYLSHMLIFQQVSRYFVGASFSESWLGFLLAISLAIAAGAALYWAVELPMNQLRDRILRKCA